MANQVLDLSRFDSQVWAMAERGERLSLAELVQRAAGKPQEQVVVETLISDGVDPLVAVAERGRVKMPFDLVRLPELSVARFQSAEGPFVLSSWPAAQVGVFHLVSSVPSSDSRWRTVERWLSGAGPAIGRCFLDHDDFLSFGAVLSEFGDVEVKMASGRVRHDHSSWVRGFPALSTSMRPSVDDIVLEAEAANAALKTLHLHVEGAIDVWLRRIAGATFTRGDFAVFQEQVLARLAASASRRLALLSGRNRVVDEPVKPPIQIVLPAPVFSDATATGEVLRVLAETSSLSFAVLHRNPYLHVIVSDDIDGSNMDVFVTEADRIELHPGFRTSMGSLARITNELSEHFEADVLQEAQAPEAPSIVELMG